jgi:hypothetical protein
MDASLALSTSRSGRPTGYPGGLGSIATPALLARLRSGCVRHRDGGSKRLVRLLSLPPRRERFGFVR